MTVYVEDTEVGNIECLMHFDNEELNNRDLKKFSSISHNKEFVFLRYMIIEK